MKQPSKRNSFGQRLKKDLRRNYIAYLLFVPVLAYYIVFCYKPMYGILIAFKDFNPTKGIVASPWAANYGFYHFITFFRSYYFGRLIRNTLFISVTTILVSFPAPIILALLLNEVRTKKYKTVIQTCSYLPHFISTVIICSMIRLFVSENGFITQMLAAVGVSDGKTSLLSHGNLFVPIYVLSGLWQTIGWSAIIYTSALAGIDQELYEAARIDGAGRWKQTLHVTLPGIMPTIMMLLILRLGSLMSVGHEKIILLYNSEIYETSDVISTYVYRKGIIESNWSSGTAIGLFNTIINFTLVMVANRISRKTLDMGLW